MSEYSEQYYRSDDGLQLYYRRYGAHHAAVPVVCLPGITRNSRDFEDLAPRLACDRRVLTPDFRGRGRSAHDANWRSYQPRTYVRDVLSLLDAESVSRAVLIGTSLGGLVSMILAAEHGERVAGVLLNDIGPEIGAAGLTRIRTYIGRVPPVASWDEAVAQVREIYGDGCPDLPDTMWARIARRGYRKDASGVPVLDMDPAIGDAARRVGTGLDDPWALFAAIGNCPLYVLQGEWSDILTDDIVQRMQRARPALRHTKIAGRGHVPLLDEADSLAAIEELLGCVS